MTTPFIRRGIWRSQWPTLAAGTAAAPALTFTGDLDTGVFSPTANTFAISTGGTERLRVDSAGNVDISTGDASIYGVRVGRGVGAIDTNTAVGASALNANTTGANNTALGRSALTTNTTGGANVAVGVNALATSNSSNNVAVGANALQLSTAAENTAVGRSSLIANTTGANNAAFGRSALVAATTGAGNVAVGHTAGDNLTTGSNNTFIGQGIDASAVGVDSELVIGQGLTGKGTQTAFVGGTSGAFNAKNVTTWETTSDERIKKNIADNSDGIDKINAIRVRSFEYRDAKEITELPASAAVARTGVQVGVIAQELQDVLPECVNKAENGLMSVSTDPLLWYLINAVQVLSAKIAALEKH